MNTKGRRTPRNQIGYTLIECLIMIAMASIVMASMSVFEHKANQRLREQHDMTQATSTATSLLDLFRARPSLLAQLPFDEHTVILPETLPVSVIPSGFTVKVLMSALEPEPLRRVVVEVTFNSMLGGPRTVRLGAVLTAQRGSL